MGNSKGKVPYQNQINTQQISYDQNLVACEPLFYLEYSYKDTYLNVNDKKVVDTVVTQLTSAAFLDMLKKEASSPQDFSAFLKVNNTLVNDKRLIFITLTFIHEMLSLLVLNSCNLKTPIADKKQEAEIKKTELSMAKEQKRLEDEKMKEEKKLQANYDKESKKVDAQLKKDQKAKNQKGVNIGQKQLQVLRDGLAAEVLKIKTPASTEPLMVQLEAVRQLIVDKLLPVFSKYNFNVMNKTTQHSRYQEYLEQRYREVVLCLAKIYSGFTLIKAGGTVEAKERFWESYQPQMPAKTVDVMLPAQNSKFHKAITNMVDLQISDLIMQGSIMNMSVRYKIKAIQLEDLDNSMEVGVDARQVFPDREVQSTLFSFQKKITPQLTRADAKDTRSGKQPQVKESGQKVSDISGQLKNQEMPDYKQINLQGTSNPSFAELKQPAK